MKKKLLAIVLTAVMLLSVSYADTTFPDLPADHWAYNAVMTLVNDGTIGGYEDGSFQPDGVVTRAEFVKMIGKGGTLATAPFTDVPEGHWAYEYVMASGLDGITANTFEPDTPITRFDVAQLVWKRNGSKTGVVMPAFITRQGENQDAVAWVYAYGIMNGDDYLDLRLQDSLTRAEAAAIIVRARAIRDDSPQIDFISHVPEDTFKAVFEGAKLFDNNTYQADRKITNGELAKAALRYASSEYNLTYRGFSATQPFEHPYAKPLYVMGKYCIGEDKVNESFIDQNATIQSTVSEMVFGGVRKSVSALDYGAKGNYYPEVTSVATDTENACLTFAYQNGISLYANGGIHASQEVTARDFAAILLQIDQLAGVHSEVVLSANSKKPVNSPMQLNTGIYPANAGQFQCILESVPKNVYEASIESAASSTPKANFDFGREYADIFTGGLEQYVAKLNTKGITLEATYYPSMVWNNGKGHTMRMKFSILNVKQGQTLGSLLDYSGAYQETQVMQGMVFYADVETGAPVLDLKISPDLINVLKIIAVE